MEVGVGSVGGELATVAVGSGVGAGVGLGDGDGVGASVGVAAAVAGGLVDRIVGAEVAGGGWVGVSGALTFVHAATRATDSTARSRFTAPP